jgi:tRNA pseudouridine38-40 synthase
MWRRLEVKSYQRLNVEDMNAAAASFTGSHDFASFAGPATPADAVTVRHISEASVERNAQGRVRVKIAGNAFLHQQVRRMTGALVRVSSGKLSPAGLQKLIDQPVRGAAGWPLGPQGLCLARIEYGKDGPFLVETEYN